MIYSGVNYHPAYLLELNLTGDWNLERTFEELREAMRYATDNLSDNEWRVIEVSTGAVVGYQSAVAGFSQELQHELRRFNSTERWRNVLTRRRTEQRRARIATTVNYGYSRNHRTVIRREVVNWIKEGV